MHVALEVQEPARPEQPVRSLSRTRKVRWAAWRGEACLWLAGLFVVVALSLADGLLNNVVAYERDTTVFYFPLMSWVGQQLRSGQFPLWTPQFFGGYPIFADGEIGLAYPPALLALVSLPPERAFVVLRLLHLCLAAGGMFVLARVWRLPYPSAVLAGLVFGLGNFLQAQIHHENIVRTASWLPLILAFTERALRSLTWRPRVGWTSLAALALGMAGLSLHSQVLAIELLVLAGYGAMRWAVGPLHLADSSARHVRARWLGRFVAVAQVCAPVVVLGLGLASVQLLPLLELASFSARGNGYPYEQAAAYSVTPIGLLQLVFPYVFRGQGSLQWGLWTHWESYIYIGLAPLALAVVALVCDRRREIVAWGIIGGIGLVLSLGQYSPINLDYLLWLVPGLSGLRAPGRFTFVVDLAAAMLAGYGLAWLMAESARSHPLPRRTLVVLSVVAAALAGVFVLVHVAIGLWPQTATALINAAYLSLPRDSYPLTAGDVLRGLAWATNLSNPRFIGGLLGIAAVLGALWAWRTSRWRGWAGWPTVLVVLTAVDLLSFGWAVHPREPLAKIASEPAAVAGLEQLSTPDAAPNRVLASPALNQVAPDRLAPFGSLQEANGYSSLQFVWHRDYLGRVLYADDSLLDLWGVRYIIDPARYGTLSSFRGVNYLPQQALLHAPAGGSLAEQRFALSGQTPIVELRFVTALMGAVDIEQGATVAQITLEDAGGNVVASAELQAGRDTMDWARDLPNVQAVAKHQRVQVAGTTTEANGGQPATRNLSFADVVLNAPVAARTMTVRATPPVGEFVLYGGAAMGSNGAVVDQLFGKTKTKYRQVYVDNEIRVLEDTAAFPRAFLVPTARVAPSLGTALSQMVHEPFQPDQEVILADDMATQSTGLTGARGGHGTARVTEYGPNRVGIHTSADGDSWLVLSDTYYPGWTATVDGQPVSVMRGDLLFRVVPVPAGEHEVEFRFEPTSVKLGALISLGALVVLIAGLVVGGRAAASRRTT